MQQLWNISCPAGLIVGGTQSLLGNAAVQA
jgi:hypothetical protein